MITEDYVSFETAKLLKEKGFVAHTEHNMWYVVEDFSTGCHWNSCTYKVGSITREYDKKCCIVMPTLQMAMKWLREVHNLHIIALPYAPIDRPPYHPGEADIVYIGQIFKGIIPIDKVGRSIIKLSPEETYEVAIKYCLENLI